MLRRLLCSVAAVLVVSAGVVLLAGPLAREVPEGVRFWGSAEATAAKQVCHWPDAEERAKYAPRDPDRAEAAKEEAEKWLRLTLNDQVVPSDVGQRMVPLDRLHAVFEPLSQEEKEQGPGEPDYIVIRYRVEDLALHIDQRQRSLSVHVQPIGRERATTVQEMYALVVELAGRIFSRDPHSPWRTISIPEEYFVKTAYGAGGAVLVGNTTMRRDQEGYGKMVQDPDLAWRWCFFSAYTDGLTVRFSPILTEETPVWLMGGGRRLGYEGWF